MRVAPEVRRLVEFRQLNFMEPFKFDKPRDIIFCRNVIIYFDKPTQAMLMQKFVANLARGDTCSSDIRRAWQARPCH